MMCDISVLISMISPRFARFGTLISAGQPRDGDDLLTVGQADAGRNLGAAGVRAEVEIADIRLRVLLVEDVDALDVIIGSHRV